MARDSRGVIRLGIVGYGRGVQALHLPALARIPEFEVVAIADTDAERLAGAERLGRVRRYEDYGIMFREAALDAIAVATPTASHAEIGLAALRMGKHLFMEKPLALNLEECAQLITAASRVPSKVVVALNNRWHRLVIRARDIIRRGTLGRLKAIRSVYTHWHPGENAQTWHKHRALGGGVLFNDGVHHFDLWRFLLDAEVTEIFAHSRPSEHFEDDTCTVSAQLDNGMTATALFSFSTSANSELEIFGDAGSLLLSLYRFDGLEFRAGTSYPGGLDTRLRSVGHTFSEISRAMATVRRGGDFSASYDALWSHFADCIGRDASPACSLEDGEKAVQIALAALESIKTRAPIPIIHAG